ncbi:MAG TPA: 50S ribosomal protein L10 [Planctomycetota bacterium]|nr:50S ribosomal protein L10 [Planctomycetota bacterium]
MPSVINQLTVAELASQLRAMSNAVLVDFTGLKAGQADALRAKLREQGADMLVVRNTLAARALCELKLAAVAALLAGPIAFIYGPDAVALTKFLRDWSRKERVLTWRGALVDGEAVGADGVEAIALLPPTNVLHALVAGAVAAPLSGFLGALQGILRNVVGVLNAIAEKREAKD